MNFLKKLFGGGSEFLGALTLAERVHVSLVNPNLCEAALQNQQKRDGARIEVASTGGSRASLLDRLTNDEIRRIRDSVLCCQDAETMRRASPEMIAKYKEAVDLNPYNPVALMSYGSQIGLAGDVAKGLKYVERALELDPNYDLARQCVTAMKRDLEKKR